VNQVGPPLTEMAYGGADPRRPSRGAVETRHRRAGSDDPLAQSRSVVEAHHLQGNSRGDELRSERGEGRFRAAGSERVDDARQSKRSTVEAVHCVNPRRRHR